VRSRCSLHRLVEADAEHRVGAVAVGYLADLLVRRLSVFSAFSYRTSKGFSVPGSTMTTNPGLLPVRSKGEERMVQRAKRVLLGFAALAALAFGGAAIADAASSNSTTTTTTTTTAQSAPAFPAHGSAAHEDAEKPVTASAAEKAQAAAVKAVGGGTAGAVTTDLHGNGYEVTVAKSDGSKVEVHLDSSFNVLQGHGHGGLGRAHGTAAHEDAEKPVTGTAATQAKAAAVKSVGSGTAGAVTTDFHGDGYEVTVTKSDGTAVEVHLDSSFNVVQGHDGHGLHG